MIHIYITSHESRRGTFREKDHPKGLGDKRDDNGEETQEQNTVIHMHENVRKKLLFCTFNKIIDK